ncbi:MAG: cobalamin biosynthesis protein, partial [Deltaproteobacteria bacterium]|nr:cobalamin biosynthesis protein [Deltaproteobacteria bacterium]
MYKYLAMQIGIAFFLDLLIGDPRWFPHPVRIVGIGIETLERVLRRLLLSGSANGPSSVRQAQSIRRRETIAGVVLMVVIVFGAYIITYGILGIGNYLGEMWEVTVGTIIIYFSLST